MKGYVVDGEALEEAPRINMSRRGVICGLAAGTVIPLVAGCTTNPYTGQTEFALPAGTLANMAATAWTDMKAQVPQSSDPRLRETVMRTWSRVERATPKAGEQWDVAVFDTDDVNAFVMPGNRVGVYRGIVELTENDDQLSTVMGHEVAHTVYNHAGRRAARAYAGQALLTAGQIAVVSNEELRQYGDLIVGLGGAALQFGVVLPYSRESELEADRAGVDYMHEAGYDVRQSVRLWELMAAQGGGNRPPEFMSTHPDPARRASVLRNYINSRGYAVI